MFTYIIWSPQGEKPPTQTYNRRWKAEYEAKRLSNAHPHRVFHVCKIKSSTVFGQTAYFGKWRPGKSGAQKRKNLNDLSTLKIFSRPEGSDEPWKEWKPAEGVKVPVSVTAVSEADLIDEQSPIPRYTVSLGHGRDGKRMITKRHIYEPLERVESAIKQIASLAKDAEENGHLMAAKKMLEIVDRDLSGAAYDLQYAEIAE